MQIYIVRHGIAEDSAPGGDPKRALTPEGLKKMKQAADGFARLKLTVHRIYSSPLVRAVQTAEIMAKQLQPRVHLMNELAPGHEATEVLKKLQQLRRAESVMLVGHEPNCSQLASYLLADSNGIDFQFKKGGICLLEASQLLPGTATMIWFLTPRILRNLAG